jgi:broad specificity phosphatase PhoE
MPLVTTAYLVRHGATAANERQPFVLQGDALDLPLNDNGLRQAQDLGRFFAARGLRAAYSSQMLRARQTVEAIATEAGLEPTALPGLQECNVGVWEGLDWDTIRARHPEACHAFQTDPAAHPMLGGESYQNVLDRVLPTWDELVARHAGEAFVLVTHNVVNRVLLARLFGLELRQGALLRQRNGCVNLIEIVGGRPQVVTVNSAFHLSDPPSAAW